MRVSLVTDAQMYARFVWGLPWFEQFKGREPVVSFKDRLALIQRSRAVPGTDVTVDAFLFTTLSPAAPKLLLNVESDDYGIVERRSCGCEFERRG